MGTSNPPLDLCLIAGRFAPHYAGPSERFRRYATGLREHGINLRVITARRSDEPESDQIDGIPIMRLAVDWENESHRTTTSRILPAALRYLRETGQRPDVLQLLTPPIPRDIPLLWRARWQGLPLALVSTMMLEEAVTLRDRLYNGLIFSPFHRIVTSSSVMTDQIVARVLFPGRLVTIPNGVDCQRFRPAESDGERAELRARLGLPLDAEIVIYVGSIVARKGVDVLATAWHAIARERPQAHLLLVGPHRRPDDGNPSHAEINTFCDKVDELLRQSGAADRVTFTGKVENVECYLRAADIFVFPSHLEGMPNVVPEAMAAGLPCVVTPFKGLPDEFGAPGDTFWLVEREPAPIAEAVLALVRDKVLYMRYRQTALDWINRHQDVVQSIRRFADLYRQLAAARAGRSPRPTSGA